MGNHYLNQALIDRYLPGSPPAEELNHKLGELSRHYTALLAAARAIAGEGIDDQNVIPFYQELCRAADSAQRFRGELLAHFAPLFPRLLLWDDYDYPGLVGQFQQRISDALPLGDEETRRLRQELSSGLLMEEFEKTFAAILGYLAGAGRCLKLMELLAAEEQPASKAALAALLGGELARHYTLISENIAGLHQICFGLDSIYNLNP